MKVKRNDPCPCGSGKKFKKCCDNKDAFDTWEENAYSILESSDYNKDEQKKLIDSFFCVLRDIRQTNLEGACHSSSSVLYVLLKEYGFLPEICIGEVISKESKLPFDHSWIEINNKVFDSAIFLPLGGNPVHNVVFFDNDIINKKNTEAVYGRENGKLDKIAKIVSETPFNEYMDAYPFYEGGLWGMVKDFSIKIGLPIDTEIIRSKYAQTKRTFKK